MIRFFYGFLALCHFYHLHTFVGKIDVEASHWLWPISWLNLVDNPSYYFYILIVIGGITSILCSLIINLRVLRILCFLSFFLSLSANVSSIRITHYYHAILFCSFWFIFMDLNKNKNSSLVRERNLFYLWVTQVSFLSTYFLVGLWKLRKFLASLIEVGWSETKCCQINIAVTHIFYNVDISLTKKILEYSEQFEKFLWIGVILFQLSCPLAAWFPPIQRFSGFVIILFHVMTALLMQITYTPSQYLALILLVCNPYQKKSKNK